MAQTQQPDQQPDQQSVPTNPPPQVLTYCIIITPGGDFDPRLKQGPAGLELVAEPQAAGGNKPMPPKWFPPNQPIVSHCGYSGIIVENSPRGGT